MSTVHATVGMLDFPIDYDSECLEEICVEGECENGCRAVGLTTSTGTVPTP